LGSRHRDDRSVPGAKSRSQPLNFGEKESSPEAIESAKEEESFPETFEKTNRTKT
jgi:hypothetical protein